MNDQDVDAAGTDERRFFFACAKKKKKDVGILLSDQGMFFFSPFAYGPVLCSSCSFRSSWHIDRLLPASILLFFSVDRSID